MGGTGPAQMGTPRHSASAAGGEGPRRDDRRQAIGDDVVLSHSG